MLVAGACWLLICLMFGCDGRAVEASAEKEAVVNASADLTHHHSFEVIRYDGCEYVRWWTGYLTGLAHKGNCTNPIHCYCEAVSVDTLRAQRNREYLDGR